MKKILIFLLLIVSLSVNAATYYISPTGNNSNSGSISAPWKTLVWACAHATASGDIIHVNAGTYNETAQSALYPGVSIEGVGATSIIKSTVGGSDFTILLYSGTVVNGNQHISNIKMDGDLLTAYGAIRVYNRSNVEINNCTLINFNYYGVSFYVPGSPVTTYATGNKFHDNIVTNCAGYFPAHDKYDGEGKGALGLNGQQTMLIYNNTIDCSGRDAGHTGYPIKGVPGYIKDIKVYNNTLIAGDYDSSTWDFCIELWYCMGGIEIYNNTMTGSLDFGEPVAKGAYTYGAWIHDNTIGRATLGQYEGFRGILVEYAAESTIIERNYIKNVAQGIYLHGDARGATRFDDVDIRYNILDNIGVNDSGTDNVGAGIEWDTDGAEHNDAVDNFNVYNNVIMAYDGVNTPRYAIELPDIGPVTTVNIKNNIGSGFNYATYAIGGTGISIATLNISNNIFYGNASYSNEPVFSGITPSSYTVNNNLKGLDPLFVSATNFHLSAGSPAINAGAHIAGLTTDYVLTAVGNPPEVGVYEYGSSPTYTVPLVTTIAVTNYTTTSVVSGGNVTSDGGAPVTDRGLCWATTVDPDLTDNVIHNSSGTGVFSSSITGLTENQVYHVRAFATNSEGTAYGADIQFSTRAFMIIVR